MTTDSVGERDIGELHDTWFEASHAKNLAASIAPIASDIVSYEHCWRCRQLPCVAAGNQHQDALPRR